MALRSIKKPQQGLATHQTEPTLRSMNGPVNVRQREQGKEIDPPNWLMAIILIVLLGASTMFLFSVTKYIREHQAKYPGFPKWSDFLYGSKYFIGFCVVRQVLCTYVFLPLGEVMIPHRKSHWDDGYREKKVSKFSISAFKFIYFSFMVVYGYVTMYDQNWFPTQLGGYGDVHNFYLNYPFAIAPEKIKTFYLFAMGYHLQCLFFHIAVLEHRRDFLEMCFHHILTVLLIVFSWMVTYFHIGCLVLFLHDVPDFFVYTTRLFVDTSWKKLSFSVYIGLMASWFYCRLYILGYLIWYKECWLLTVDPFTGGYIYGRMVLMPMLGSLVLLHMYWFVKLFFMGLTYVQEGLIIDTHHQMVKTTGQHVIEDEIDEENKVYEQAELKNGYIPNGVQKKHT